MKLLKWLSVADRFAKACLDEKLAPCGINSSQHMYLLKVCREPGITQESLLETFYVHPSNVVRMISALERKGFLRREPCHRDKRTWRLYPTQKALDVAPQVRQACRETEDCLLEEFTGEEATLLERLLFQAGRHMAREMNITRKEDEFDE